MTDEHDWAGEESGPFCRHWSEAGYCEQVCSACGHSCPSHDSGPCSTERCQCDGFAEESRP